LAAVGFRLVLVARSQQILAQMQVDLSDHHAIDVVVIPADLRRKNAIKKVESGCRSAV
jgi:short-subunit dehydrogenase